MGLTSRLVAVKVKLVNWLLIADIIVNVNYDRSDAIELVSVRDAEDSYISFAL